MKYFWLTLKHKWFVLRAGIKVKVPLWHLIIHDMSKLTFIELPHYQRQFFGKADDSAGFIGCWVHHQNNNPHHWEYWIPRTGHNHCIPPYPDNVPIPMPECFVREMVADWLGAGRAYEGKWPNIYNWFWFDKNFPDIRSRCHPITVERTLRVIEELKYSGSYFDDIRVL